MQGVTKAGKCEAGTVLGAFAGCRFRAAGAAWALALRGAGLPHKLAGYQRQLVEGAGCWRGVGWDIAGHVLK